MITEDYVSFEVAKLLKEKGFKEYCRTYYTNYRIGFPKIYNSPQLIDNKSLFEMGLGLSAPTLQMAMKWLRDTYKLCIVIEPIITDDDGSAGCLWRFSISKLLELQYKSESIYECYEVACEAAIKYCLNNLI